VEVDCSALALRILSRRREDVGDRGANMTDLLEVVGSRSGEVDDEGVMGLRRYCHQELWMKVGY